MRAPLIWRVIASALIGVLFGCSNGPGQSALYPTGLKDIQAKRIPVRVAYLRSWMASDAMHKDLLYISNAANNTVDAYSYPKGKLEGQITGFDNPQGECVDTAGNIWIANVYASEILEYAHGGTTPINTLADPYQWPDDCAFDPVNGNLAVANNIAAYGAGPGSVSIYKNAQGTPKTYYDPFYSYAIGFLDYDDKGNLYVDASGGRFELGKLPKRGNAISVLTVTGLKSGVHLAGGVKWNGQYLTVGDEGYGSPGPTVIYKLHVKGSIARIVGGTVLNGSCIVVEYTIHGSKVVGPDHCLANARFWNYPVGGQPMKTISGLSGPIGTAISPGQ